MKTSLCFLCFSVLLFAGFRDPGSGDLEENLKQLKTAETAKDAAEVKRLAAETCRLARLAQSEPAPADAADKESWEQRIASAHDIELYTEYALFATGVQGPPAVTVDLIAALEQQNPKSKYLAEAYGRYFLALNQTAGASRIPAVAEKAVANFPSNEDLLLVLADTAMSTRQTDRALSYAERLLTALSRHGVPEGMSAADWERKRTACMGRGHWIAGLMHAEKTQYYEADRDLRASLPLIGGEEMRASALFYLGVANYQLGSAARNRAQVLEAARFSEQAASMKGPLSQQAWRNAQVMKAEAGKMR